MSRLGPDAPRAIICDKNDLTDQQLGSFQLLRHQRRAMIVGGAGTGKTVIACTRARQLAEDGFRTLLLSYNRPIGDRLADELQGVENVWAGSFHGRIFSPTSGPT